MKPLIVGNWKMHKAPEGAAAFIEKAKSCLGQSHYVDVVVCPPAVDLAIMHEAMPRLTLGAQNIYLRDSGPFTGEISAPMITPYASHVILGHSERRVHFGETNELVNAKIRSAVVNGLNVILCVGETGDEKRAGQSRAVVQRQLTECLAELTPTDFEKITVAYEPVWAISTMPGATGETDAPVDAQVMHKLIRKILTDSVGEEHAFRVIYGGSVKPDSIEPVLVQPDIDGALVGHASLSPEDFCAIIEIAKRIAKDTHAD